MSAIEIRKTPQWRIDSWFVDLPPATKQKLREFSDVLFTFNSKLNLISPKTEQNMDLIHVADGLLGAQQVLKSTDKKTIFDIGSGN